jgi:hypothetical protein
LNRFVQRWRERLADRRLHEFLWFCVPGVLVGLALRVWLTAAMPYGYYHPDTHDFLVTPHVLRTEGRLTVHNKTTFLTPLAYTVPFVLKTRALVAIPLGQHLRGLLLVLMAGALCRLWFTRWRWWIIPLTALMAMQPAMLFWEHTLMSESGFVFCAVWLALAGTLFARWQNWETFGFLLAAMCLVAGARPEGAILTGAGALLTLLVCWGQWRQERVKIFCAFALWGVMLSTMQTSHSGLLLYSSLVHLTPDDPRSVPGLGPYIRPLRDEMLQRREQAVSNDVVRTGKRIAKVLMAYAKDHPDVDLGIKRKKRSDGADDGMNDLERALKNGPRMSLVCRRLAREAALKHPFALPGIAARKFLAKITGDSGGQFEDYIFHKKQAFSLMGEPKITAALGRDLAGVPLETPEQAEAFVNAHYDMSKVEWFNQLNARWQRAVNHFHLPPIDYSPTYKLPGLPVIYLLAICGAAVSLVRPGAARRFHWAFVPTLLGMWFVVAVAAAVIPRHRFILEPFWLLYFFAFWDFVVWMGVLAARKLRRQKVPAMPTQSASAGSDPAPL